MIEPNIQGPGIGMFPRPRHFRIINGTSGPLLLGRIVALDFTGAAATLPATNWTEGDKRSALAVARLPIAAEIAGNSMTLFGVVRDRDLAAGEEGRVGVFGNLPAHVQTGFGTAFQQLMLNTSGQLLIAAGAGTLIVARNHVVQSAAGPQVPVFFNGYAGLFARVA